MYLQTRNNEAYKMIEDPVQLWKSGDFNEETDKLYKLGGEVKLKITLEPVTKLRAEENWR